MPKLAKIIGMSKWWIIGNNVAARPPMKRRLVALEDSPANCRLKSVPIAAFSVIPPTECGLEQVCFPILTFQQPMKCEKWPTRTVEGCYTGITCKHDLRWRIWLLRCVPWQHLDSTESSRRSEGPTRGDDVQKEHTRSTKRQGWSSCQHSKTGVQTWSKRHSVSGTTLKTTMRTDFSCKNERPWRDASTSCTTVFLLTRTGHG